VEPSFFLIFQKRTFVAREIDVLSPLGSLFQIFGREEVHFRSARYLYHMYNTCSQKGTAYTYYCNRSLNCFTAIMHSSSVPTVILKHPSHPFSLPLNLTTTPRLSAIVL
jgi:hypothetical protein